MNSAIEYNGHTITVTDDYRFAISGPTIEKDGHDRYSLIYDSMSKAKERIDERVKQAERQNREKLSIPMLAANGNPVTITGIHAGHYGLLGIGFKGSYDTLYPATDAVRAMIHEVSALRQRLTHLQKTLGWLEISTGGPGAAYTYDDALKLVLARIETANKLARELEVRARLAAVEAEIAHRSKT
jgi:hypothetical protein